MDIMTNLEIKERIDFLNKQIEKFLSPNKFTLNNVILELQKEIWELQEECNHEYKEGYCEYCYKAEE